MFSAGRRNRGQDTAGPRRPCRGRSNRGPPPNGPRPVRRAGPFLEPGRTSTIIWPAVIRYLSEQDAAARGESGGQRDGGGSVLDNLTEERAVGLWSEGFAGRFPPGTWSPSTSVHRPRPRSRRAEHHGQPVVQDDGIATELVRQIVFRHQRPTGLRVHLRGRQRVGRGSPGVKQIGIGRARLVVGSGGRQVPRHQRQDPSRGQKAKHYGHKRQTTKDTKYTKGKQLWPTGQ